MFLRVLTAMLAADAFDRHMREQQRQRWQAHDRRHQAPHPPDVPPPAGRQHPHRATTFSQPERPR